MFCLEKLKTMQKQQRENKFSEKFRMLNSQENNENIHWSSSESSDYENISITDKFCNKTNKIGTRKRKRKKKVPKNVTNLNITIIDSSKDNKDVINISNKSDHSVKFIKRSRESSPVLAATPTTYFPPYKSTSKVVSSPVLACKTSTQARVNKSPILGSKYVSPIASPKVRKTLFSTVKPDRTKVKITNVETCDNNVSQSVPSIQIKAEISKYFDRRKDIKQENIPEAEESTSKSTLYPRRDVNDTSSSKEVVTSTQSNENLEGNVDDSFEKPKCSGELAKKIKSYFDSHFSNSQQSVISISDASTPKDSTKVSDDYDILTCLTQINGIKIVTNDDEGKSKNISSASSESAEINITKTKKTRYKKNGLAYRLNALLKKQNASVSLWQHERFLADNSNFVIPKGENMALRIQKLNYKYGCHQIQAVNTDDQEFLIIINNIYVTTNNFRENMILKLYDPYNIVDFNEDCKLIVNVCKFECIDFYL